jgi:hypothetical protein
LGTSVWDILYSKECFTWTAAAKHGCRKTATGKRGRGRHCWSWSSC